MAAFGAWAHEAFVAAADDDMIVNKKKIDIKSIENQKSVNF